MAGYQYTVIIGNVGRDPFGDPSRKPITPTRIVKKLSALGAWGVNLHDNDLVPIDATRQQRNKIVRDAMMLRYLLCPTQSTLEVSLLLSHIFSYPPFTFWKHYMTKKMYKHLYMLVLVVRVHLMTVFLTG